MADGFVSISLQTLEYFVVYRLALITLCLLVAATFLTLLLFGFVVYHSLGGNYLVVLGWPGTFRQFSIYELPHVSSSWLSRRMETEHDLECSKIPFVDGWLFLLF